MTGQIALLTGGSRGIGRSAVNHLAARGIDVIFTYNSDADAADAVVAEAGAKGARVSAVKLDVSDVDTSMSSPSGCDPSCPLAAPTG